jgi:hypothetical protein
MDISVKGFATIDNVSLINIEGTGMVGVPGEAGGRFVCFGSDGGQRGGAREAVWGGRGRAKVYRMLRGTTFAHPSPTSSLCMKPASNHNL